MHVGILKRAIQEAEQSFYYPYKVAAVIFKGSRIIASANNQLRYCKDLKDRVWIDSLHAEQAAIRSVENRSIKGYDILVIRLTKTNNLRMAKPCPICMKLIQEKKIRNIYYSNSSGEIKRMKA